MLEQRSRDYCLARVRAGVLEHDVAQLMRDLGVGERMDRDGLVHDGHRAAGRRRPAPRRLRRADRQGRDRLRPAGADARPDRAPRGGPAATCGSRPRTSHVHDVTTDAPRRHVPARRRATHELRCAIVAGCDGFHGVCREPGPGGACARRSRPRTRTRGSASSRTPRPPPTSSSTTRTTTASRCTRCGRPTVSRLYLQVAPDERIDDWPDDRIWDELDARFARRDEPAFRVGRGRDDREGHHADALVRVGADAARPAVPGRRRRAHRARPPAPRA